KFRIVFILEELLTNIETYSNVITYLVNQFGADKACKSAERMFFGNLDAEVEILGNILGIDTIMDISNQINEIKTIENEFNKNRISENIVKEMLGYIPKQLDYMDWFAIISAVGNTFDENIACKLVDEWSPSSNPD